MPQKPLQAQSSRAVPFEFSGKWIAWSTDHSHILAAADTIGELWTTVRERGILDPVFEKVPLANVRLVGKR